MEQRIADEFRQLRPRTPELKLQRGTFGEAHVSGSLDRSSLFTALLCRTMSPWATMPSPKLREGARASKPLTQVSGLLQRLGAAEISMAEEQGKRELMKR